MADIRNDGTSKIDIDYAELLGDDFNLQMQEKKPNFYSIDRFAESKGEYDEASPATVEEGKEVADLYVFTINKPFAIDAKTNYLLPMFRPQVTIERFGLIQKTHFQRSGKIAW